MTDSPFRSTTPAGQTDELLNKPYLDRQFRDRNQHFSLLIEDFEELATLLMQRLAQAIERNDYSAYRDALHELAGTAGSLGAWAIERVCETASAWPPSQLAEAQPTLLVEIERTIVQTQVALVEYQRHRGLSVEALATDPTTVDRPPSSQPPRTLLLVEDNPLIRRQLREILHADYRLLETTTGSEALLYCQQTPPPDLVILDLKLTLRHDAKDEALTKVSGLELAHRFPHGCLSSC